MANDHQTLFSLTSPRTRDSTPLALAAIGTALLIALVSALVAYARITKTYGDFDDAVFPSFWGIVFIVLNVLVTAVVLLILTATVKPKRWIPWAIVVAASIQTVITSPISLTPLNDADVPGGSTTVKIADLYNPVEGFVTKRLDGRVVEKRTEERAAFVSTYLKAGKAGKMKLLNGLDNRIDDETQIPLQKDKDELKAELRAIIEDRKKEPAYERRLNAVVTRLYGAGLREVVQALAKKT